METITFYIFLFFEREKDVFVSCHGHNLFHIDRIFHFIFLRSNKTQLRKSFSNFGNECSQIFYEKKNNKFIDFLWEEKKQRAIVTQWMANKNKKYDPSE